jgi:hypothetical protein
MALGRSHGRGKKAVVYVLVVASQLVGPAAAAERQGLVAGDNDHTGDEAQPVREYRDAAGRLCRVYERRIVIGGEARVALATVCRDANGRWVLSR